MSSNDQNVQEAGPPIHAILSHEIVLPQKDPLAPPTAPFTPIDPQMGGPQPATPTPAPSDPVAIIQRVFTTPVADVPLPAVASPIQDPKQAQSQSREQMVQQIASRLQTSLGNSPTNAVRATSSADSGNGKTGGQDSNHSSGNSAAQDLSKQSAVVTPNTAAAHTDAASAATQINQTADSAAAVKAAGLLAASVEQSLHAPADAPAQSAGAGAGSIAPRPAAPESPVNTLPTPLPQPLPPSLGDVVKASELYQRVGGAEMHINMQTDLFGSIDLRTVIHQSTLTATIGVQRADVQTALANDLPALQHALADQKLHVEQISVLDNSTAGRMDLGGREAQQHSAPTAQSAASASGVRANQSEDMQLPGLEILAMGESAGLLSVHV